MLKKRILITYVANKYVAVDISSVKTETGGGGTAPWLCFNGWSATADYLRTLQADETKVRRAFAALRRVSAAVVAIAEPSAKDANAAEKSV